MERKGGGQGTRANGHELCSWETGILDTLQPDSNPSGEPRVWAPSPSSLWGPRVHSRLSAPPSRGRRCFRPHQNEGSRRKRGVSVWRAVAPIFARLLRLPSRLIFFLHGHLAVEGVRVWSAGQRGRGWCDV